MLNTFPGTYYPVGIGQSQGQVSDDAGKIFVGGIPADATKETLSDYFSQYGNVSDSIIMVDNTTGRSRGFGFVTFMDAITVNKVLASNKHTINGKVVDAKRAVPKGPNQSNILRAMGITSNRADRNPDCKVFVGGVPQGTTESDLETYFKEFGNVLEVKIPKDQNTQRARGFSFVLFDTAEAVLAATKQKYHGINGKMVEVKTVQIQPSKFLGSQDGSEELQNPSYMQLNQSGYYQGYHPRGYLGVSPGISPAISPRGFYEHPYEPSPGGSTGSAASMDSANYGSLSSSAPRGQGLDNYSYMAPLYPGMADLSISQRYHGNRNFAGQVRGYQLSAGGQVPSAYALSGGPSQSGGPYHGEYSTAPVGYSGSNYPGSMSGGAHSGGGGSGTQQQVATYAPASTPQSLVTNPTFSR